jgi:DNA-3-methyladenine glycosylase
LESFFVDLSIKRQFQIYGIYHKMKKLKSEFYNRTEVVHIAKELLGKVLCTRFEDTLTSGMIVEVEAYAGREDKACHANMNRRTKRTEIMYAAGGHAYVYLCYGIHHLFNVVTNTQGMADAVLVRAIEPVDGIEVMLKRRKMKKAAKRLTSGPGVLSSALGITTGHYGHSLLGDLIWIEDRGMIIPDNEIVRTPRIGVDYAGEDALKPWRFYIRNNIWVSAL